MKEPIIKFFTRDTKTFVPHMIQIKEDINNINSIEELIKYKEKFDINNFKYETDANMFLDKVETREREIMGMNK